MYFTSTYKSIVSVDFKICNELYQMFNTFVNELLELEFLL